MLKDAYRKGSGNEHSAQGLVVDHTILASICIPPSQNPDESLFKKHFTPHITTLKITHQHIMGELVFGSGSACIFWVPIKRTVSV